MESLSYVSFTKAACCLEPRSAHIIWRDTPVIKYTNPSHANLLLLLRLPAMASSIFSFNP
jgi:hypothetical protein